jgi:hypothetical protein
MEAIRSSETLVTTPTRPHDVTTQKTTINIFIAVRTPNLNQEDYRQTDFAVQQCAIHAVKEIVTWLPVNGSKKENERTLYVISLCLSHSHH